MIAPQECLDNHDAGRAYSAAQAQELATTRRKWAADKRLLAGALRLLRQADAAPDSAALLAAAEAQAASAEDLARLRAEVHLHRTECIPAMGRMVEELELLRRVAGPGSAEGDRIIALEHWVAKFGRPAK